VQIWITWLNHLRANLGQAWTLRNCYLILKILKRKMKKIPSKKKPLNKGEEVYAKPGEKLEPESFLHIAAQLRPLAVAMDKLVPDPRNARKHDEKNIAAIAASLREFGQLKPIVVHRETMEIEAGNGAYLAAKQLGWTHLAAVMVEHDPAAANGFKIADNRTAELAEWDLDILGDLLGEIQEDSPTLFDELLLSELLPDADDDNSSGQVEEVPAVFQVVVKCENEHQQQKLFVRLEKEGYDCKLSTL
jgi:hypothetical protein